MSKTILMLFDFGWRRQAVRFRWSSFSRQLSDSRGQLARAIAIERDGKTRQNDILLTFTLKKRDYESSNIGTNSNAPLNLPRYS
jgi:hypothetical protein